MDTVTIVDDAIVAIKIRDDRDTVLTVLHSSVDPSAVDDITRSLETIAKESNLATGWAQLRTLCRYGNWTAWSADKFDTIKLREDDVIFDVYPNRIFKGGISGVSYVV